MKKTHKKTVSFENNFIEEPLQDKVATETIVQPQGMDIRKPQTIPVITLSGLSLSVICPLLIVAHIYTAHLAVIPLLQYVFLSLLVGYAINYIFILRKYEILPYLPQQKYDNQLKFAIIFGFIGILCSLTWGWNGSGGLLFAILWQKIRGNKMGTFSYLYLLVIIGSLLMEDGFTLMKIIEFIPGILFGIANSMIFTLKESSTYVLAHQFMFFTSLCLPIIFPLHHIVVLTLFQWIVMVLGGVVMHFTVIWTVKLMQRERVSIVMSVISGIIMLGVSSYLSPASFVGAVLIVIGIIFILKKQYLDLQF